MTDEANRVGESIEAAAGTGGAAGAEPAGEPASAAVADAAGKPATEVAVEAGAPGAPAQSGAERPESPEGYAFALPEGLPEHLPYDEAFATKFRTWAHEAGLSTTQAQALHDAYLRDFADVSQATAAAEAEAIGAAHDEVVKAWGEPSGEGYRRNVELAARAIRETGGTELVQALKELGALGPNGEVKSPAIAFAFAKVGAQLHAEDALYGGTGAVANPFADRSENLTEQGRMLRSDPEQAASLIRAAGKDPRVYGLA